MLTKGSAFFFVLLTVALAVCIFMTYRRSILLQDFEFFTEETSTEAAL